MIASKLLAFFEHGFVLTRSYRLNFFARYLTAFVTVVFYVFLAELFRRMRVTVAPGAGYFSFLLIGGAFSKYVEIGMGALSRALREEMLMGTLEPLLATATPMALALLGPSLFIVAEGTLLVLAQLAMGAAFGADLSRANWLSAIAVTGLLIACLYGWGIISAAFTLRARREDPVLWFVGAISYVFSGVFFPVSTLPPAMQIISYALPFTYGLQALRGALLQGRALEDLGPEMAALALFTAVLLPLALWSIWGTMRYLKRTGELGHY